MSPDTASKNCLRCYGRKGSTAEQTMLQRKSGPSQKSHLDEGAEHWGQAFQNAANTEELQDVELEQAMNATAEETTSLLEVILTALDGP